MMEYDVFRENVILVNKLILSILNRNMMFLVFLHEKNEGSLWNYVTRLES